MVHITPFFLLSIATGISLATPTERTVPQVLADINVVSTRVTSLDNAITAFPLTGGSLVAALGIHTSAGTVITSLKAATGNATGPVDEIDGNSILNAVQAFEPTIQHALAEIVVKKPAFVALPVGGLPLLILQDLRFLKGNTTEFSSALIENAPESLIPAATALQNGILESFDTAISAYT
uniref:Antigenic cell wall galactomannoprotein n=1 Tax=Psilocybe cubensis TaxID=181762 RepID=A0A8H7XS85_PSICU